MAVCGRQRQRIGEPNATEQVPVSESNPAALRNSTELVFACGKNYVGNFLPTNVETIASLALQGEDRFQKQPGYAVTVEGHRRDGPVESPCEIYSREHTSGESN